MVNIAFVIDAIDSPRAGTENQLLSLLSRLDRNRFNPRLCVFRQSNWLAQSFDVCPVHVIGIHSFKSPATLLCLARLVRYLRENSVDIVQTFFKDGNKVGTLAGKLAGVRCIISSRRTQGYWLTTGELIILRLLDRLADLVVVNSYSTMQWVKRTEGVHESKIRVVQNGVDLTAVPEVHLGSRVEVRRRYSIPEGAVVIGTVANLRPVKGHEVLLRAAQLVIQDVPSAYFILVGAGEREHALRELAGELGIEERVRFLGSQRDVFSILGALDIGALASHSESFSNAVLEYMAAGLPVISTDVGGAREAIEDGVNGFVVPVGDYRGMARCIADVAANPARAEMGRLSLAKVGAKFSLSRMIEQHEEIYERYGKRS